MWKENTLRKTNDSNIRLQHTDVVITTLIEKLAGMFREDHTPGLLESKLADYKALEIEISAAIDATQEEVLRQDLRMAECRQEIEWIEERIASWIAKLMNQPR